jgi:hypothetical protein
LLIYCTAQSQSTLARTILVKQSVRQHLCALETNGEFSYGNLLAGINSNYYYCRAVLLPTHLRAPLLCVSGEPVELNARIIKKATFIVAAAWLLA